MRWEYYLILLLAAFLRLSDLSELPVGLNFDEAGNGVAALEILHGQPQLWWTIGGGKEPLWPYLLSLPIATLGNTPLPLRLTAAFIGIVTVAVAYRSLRTLFAPQPDGQWVALLTALALATSAWHLHFSRLGFRAILLPLLSTLVVYFFWRSLNQPASRTPRRTLYASLAALCTALAIYSYLAARLLPLVPLLFLLIARPRPPHPASRITAFAYLLSLTLCLMPLMAYFSYHPDQFMARTTTVSIFSQAEPLATAGQTALLTMITFMGLDGDSNPLVNLPHAPAVPLYLTPFLLIGLLRATLDSINRTARQPTGFILIWWLVMLLPAILAPDGAPHHLRLLGTIVPTYALLALGVVTVGRGVMRLSALSTAGNVLAQAGLILACGLLTTQTYCHYFIQWPNAVDFNLPFDWYAAELAEQIASAPPHVAYVLPMDIRAAAEARHYSLDYRLNAPFPHKNRTYFYLPVDEANAETVLRQAVSGNSELRLVRWRQDKHQAADEKEIVTYLLERQAQQIDQRSSPVYDLERYAIPNDFSPELPNINQPLGTDFEGLLRLDAAHVPPTASPSDEWLPVALTIAPLTAMTVDYKASIRLIGSAGERLAQKDRTLRHNFHQGTSLWPPETVNEYYLLPLPTDIAAGRYQVTALFYHPETQTPLVADGAVEVVLGDVEIR